MICPHCGIGYREEEKSISLESDRAGLWYLSSYECPECNRAARFLTLRPSLFDHETHKFLVYPKATGRTPCPPQVPEEIAEDYTEACLVLNDSPKASAALSRRCLHLALDDINGVEKRTLDEAIKLAKDSGKVQGSLGTALDLVRVTGNFAAHAIKSESTGTIVQVEPGEAELNLETLEMLFDFHYVQRDKLKKAVERANEKLEAAGKPTIKTGDE